MKSMKKLKDFSKFLLIFSICLINDGVKCLYEDQAGTYDWRQQYVGRPLFSNIDLSTNRIYLATDQNVLGAVNIKNGNLAWRKIFESNENGKVDFVLWGSKELIVVNEDGNRIQSFNYNNGFANWEYVLFNQHQGRKQKIIGIESKLDMESYYLTNGYQLCYVSLKDKVCVDLPSDGGFVYVNLFESDQGLFLIGIKDSSIQKIQFNSQLTSILSKAISTQNGNLKWLKPNIRFLKSADSNHFVSFSLEDKKVFLTQAKVSSSIEFNEYRLPSSLFDESEKKLSLVWHSKDVYIFESYEIDQNQSNHKNLKLYLVKQQDNLALVKTIQSITNYEIKSKDKNPNEYYLVYANYKKPNGLSFNVLDLKNDQKSEHVINVQAQKETKPILKFSVYLSETKNGQLNLITFCFFHDYSMSVFNNLGVKYFTREEGLAYITSVEMIDFPLLHLQEEFEDEFGTSQQDNILTNFIKRIRSQLFQLKEFVFIDLYQKLVNYINPNSIKRPSNTAGSASSTVTLLPEEITRDEFNLNKLIVAATSIGKVFGLYTGSNGKILWSFFLKNTKPYDLNKFKLEKSVPLLLQRSVAHFPYEAQCVLICKLNSENKDYWETVIYFFNPLTGKPSKDYPKEGLIADYQVKQAFLSNTPDSHFLKPLIILDHENKLHVFPESATDDLIYRSSKPSVIYLTSHDEEKSSLIGYEMKYINKPLLELWRINIDDEKIIAIGSKLNSDRIHSHGKVLGDRSVLYKYLNPNLIGVVTTGQDGQKVPFVNLYLIDTVTGSIINSFNHKRCKGPVHIVHSENWFFYSYYNLKYRRHEVTSIELFEGSTQFNSTHFSSVDDIKPVVYTKSYIIQRAFDSMQITLTEKGISTKDVIVACQFGVVIEIPWILIDPRRPLKMTEVEKEENLLPYMPEIPLNYEFSLNYYNYVYNIRGITTAPSGLESTSLVFAYGLDVYFTRVFPSKTFDMLREDFDYFFITTLMVGLLLGTILSKKLASASNLKKAWK